MFESISERSFACNMFQKDHAGKRKVFANTGISAKSSLKANALLTITVDCRTTQRLKQRDVRGALSGEVFQRIS